MPGLVPGIHVLRDWKNADGRVKPGHDAPQSLKFDNYSDATTGAPWMRAPMRCGTGVKSAAAPRSMGNGSGNGTAATVRRGPVGRMQTALATAVNDPEWKEF